MIKAFIAPPPSVQGADGLWHRVDSWFYLNTETKGTAMQVVACTRAHMAAPHELRRPRGGVVDCLACLAL